MIKIIEDGAKKTVQRLSLIQKRQRWARLDVIPFASLYIIPLAIFFSYDATSDDARFPRLICLSCQALLLLIHVLVFLMQQWSKTFKCWIGYTRVTSISTATHVLAEPLPHCGSSAICPLIIKKPMTSTIEKASETLQYSFGFQRLIYRYSDQLPAATNSSIPTTSGFTRLEYPTSNPLSTYRNAKGMTSKTMHASTMEYYGANKIELPIPPFLELFSEHLLAPFFVFQVFCVALWMLDEYWYYSLFTLAMLLVFESTVCYTRIKSMQDLRGQAKTPPNVYVYRSKQWSKQPVSAATLVPGDIVSLQTNNDRSSTVPCDALLLRGSAIVNEAMLTGESVPLLKESMLDNMDNESLRFTNGTDKNHQKNVVFCGTQILKLEESATTTTTTTSSSSSSSTTSTTVAAIKKNSLNIPTPPDNGAVAYVLRTGFGTTQGELMRTILFATERVTVGDTETLLLLFIMLIFAIFASAYVLNEGLKDTAASRWKLFLHCTMICTSVVPPELPMELSLAVTNSLNALRNRMIYCVEPFRIPYAGKVDICCFDKTGTLTSDQFRVEGVVSLIQKVDQILDTSSATSSEEKLTSSSSFEMVRDLSMLDLKTQRVLGCCHSILRLNGTMAGDPMEVATVDALKWHVQGDVVFASTASLSMGNGIDIIRRYGFSSSLKRMSVVVRIRSEQNKLYVLTKGAPEIMSTLYDTTSYDSDAYEKEQRKYTSKGKRVLGLGWKSLDTIGITNVSMLDEIDRTYLETNLICSGLLILDSPLKPQSKPAITQLIQSSHRVVVITGDNPLTACSVASQVGILSRSRTQQYILNSDLLWHRVSSTSNASNKEKNQEKNNSQNVQSNSSATIIFDGKDPKNHLLSMSKKFDLCITGGAFIALANKYNLKNENDNEPNGNQEEVPMFIMNPIVTNVLVFARTAPVQKERILTSLKSQGYTTLMCGDGTNDVGALKQADVGISIINSIEMDQKAEIVSKIVNNKNQKSKKKKGSTNQHQELNRLLREMELEMENSSQQVQLGDASVASGFTSKTASIACALDVIRQGRCTLVTTLQMYKILAVNCLVTAYNLSALYLHGVKQGDTQMTAVGLAIAAFFFFVSRSKPMNFLAKERPPSKVFSPFVLLSVLFQCIIHFVVQIVALKWTTPYVDPSDPSMMRDGDFRPNVINTVVFIGTLVTQANSFGANYSGEPFMESFRDNKWLSRSLVIAWCVAALCATDFFPPLNDMLQLVPLPSLEFRLKIFGLYVTDTVLIFTAEHFVRKYYGTEKSKLQQYPYKI